MKPLSHVYVANAVINGIRANGGRVKLGSLGTFPVKAEFRVALMDETYAPFVRAGAVGPDAFPGSLMFRRFRWYPVISESASGLATAISLGSPAGG